MFPEWILQDSSWSWYWASRVVTIITVTFLVYVAYQIGKVIGADGERAIASEERREYSRLVRYTQSLVDELQPNERAKARR